LTAYIGDDDAIYIRALSEVRNDQDGHPSSESLDRVGPGEEFAGRTFDEWHQFLKARGGVALLKV